MYAVLTTQASVSLVIIVRDTTSEKYAKTDHVETVHARKDIQESVISSSTLETANLEQIVDIFMKAANQLLLSLSLTLRKYKNWKM